MEDVMKRIYEYICKGETVVAAVCFSVSCVIIFISAVLRSFSKPINWGQDMSLFLFAWSVFLSADVALRADKLIKVDMLVNHFPARLQKLISIAIYIIILAFLVAMLIYGSILSYRTRIRVFQGIPGFSYTWVTLSVPIGSLGMIITVLIKLKESLGKNPEENHR
jgi:TRAP-type C4-dicarboxylate transport system permease small subunit